MKIKITIITVVIVGLSYLGMQLAGGGEPLQAAAADDRSPLSDRPENMVEDDESFLSITMVDEDLAADDPALLDAQDEGAVELANAVAADTAADIDGDEPLAVAPDLVNRSNISVLPGQARPGVVGMLMRIEQHGRATGVECEHIDAPSEPGSTYDLRGRGPPTALAIFLASLEGDPSLGGATSLRVWAEDERYLGFSAQLLVADEQER